MLHLGLLKELGEKTYNTFSQVIWRFIRHENKKLIRNHEGESQVVVRS